MTGVTPSGCMTKSRETTRVPPSGTCIPCASTGMSPYPESFLNPASVFWNVPSRGFGVVTGIDSPIWFPSLSNILTLNSVLNSGESLPKRSINAEFFIICALLIFGISGSCTGGEISPFKATIWRIASLAAAIASGGNSARVLAAVTMSPRPPSP